MKLLQEGGPLPDPRVGSCLALKNEFSVETRKARDFIEKGHQGGEQQGKVTQGNCSATWLVISGFMVMG